MDQQCFKSDARTIGGDWVDFNGHMSMIYYPIAFETFSIPVFEGMGFGQAYVEATKKTLFTLETHIRFLRELHAGDRVLSVFRYVDHDRNKFVYAQELHHVDGWLSATFEALTVHMDTMARKSVPFSAQTLALFADLAAAAEGCARPDYLGRSVGIRRKGASV